MDEKWRPYLSLLKDIALGVALWLLITTFVGEARQIPSSSMEPTIQIGDRVWTDKLLLRFSPITRGDIVVFDPPPSEASDYPYIKRVIGLPGETVEVKGGKVLINGQPLTEPYIAEPPHYVVKLTQIPPGHYYVLGDNRNASNDSHRWGLLKREQISARAVFRFWPFSRFGKL
ncbi:MAG: signal peptidase I [Bacillota bacterium]